MFPVAHALLGEGFYSATQAHCVAGMRSRIDFMSSGIQFPFVIPGCAILAQARNPYSLWCRLVLNETQGVWIPGSLASLAPRNDDSFFVVAA
jgi:hypothetical protein